MINLYDYQKEALELTKNHNKVAYYYDMGLGKTFIGSEKLKALNADTNLLVCQLSKINDWVQHFKTLYPDYITLNLRNSKEKSKFFLLKDKKIGIINYDSVWRIEKLKEFLKDKEFTLMLDESSQIKNEKRKKSKYILNLKPPNVILLSGTPVSGKYEEIWSQCQLLGWNITKKLFEESFIIFRELDIGRAYPIKIVTGYKKIDRLKNKLKSHGALFKKTEEVIDLPKQNHIKIEVDNTKEYKDFVKNRIINIKHNNMNLELVGDTTLTKRLYKKQLASVFNQNKINALKDLIESTNDRLIIFYNWNAELFKLKEICKELNKPVSEVNGTTKDLTNYEKEENSVTLIQYQAGSMGLNLQKSNKIIYFSLPDSSEYFEQSKKRTHRVGQEKSCFYYYLLTKKSIDNKIFEVLEQRKNYTDYLFTDEEEDI